MPGVLGEILGCELWHHGKPRFSKTETTVGGTNGNLRLMQKLDADQSWACRHLSREATRADME